MIDSQIKTYLRERQRKAATKHWKTKSPDERKAIMAKVTAARKQLQATRIAQAIR